MIKKIGKQPSLKLKSVYARGQPITKFKFGLLMELCSLGSLEDYMQIWFRCEPAGPNKPMKIQI